ncbi:MAG: glycosyltransferase family 2 protein [Clostridia bacterium]|nr:glycosyltransferase family 2 protein [Clostridia bacterium]
MNNLIISLCIVAYNEEKCLPELFDDILKQNYPKEKTEIILIDNGSTDGTAKLMSNFLENNQFYSSKLIRIKKNNLAVGCNEAIKGFTGDIYVRVDAHSGIRYDFLSKIVECMENGEKVCGGYRPCITQDDTHMQNTLLTAEESMFGSSFASYRRNHNEKTYTSSLFHIAVMREVFEKCGVYDERLGRTEDNEFTYRLRQNGYKLCFSPDIYSEQKVRSTLGKIVSQKYKNGYWIGLTTAVCPQCFSLFHFVPLCFVLALIVAIILFVFGIKLPLAMLSAVYLLFILMITITATITSKKRNSTFVALPIIFIMLHISYGIGTLIGLIKMPAFKNKTEKH